MNLHTTYGVLAAIVVLFVYCYWRDRQPVNLAKPRLLPYKLILMLLLVAFLAAAAHAVSLLTGTPIVPRTGKMR
jgi:hypothetical protein